MRFSMVTLSVILLFYHFLTPGSPSTRTLTARDTTPKPTCVYPLDCANNLANPLLPATAIDSFTYSYANPDTIYPTYHDVTFKNGQKASADCIIPADNCTNDTSSLRYRVYYPSPRVYNYKACKKLPLVVLFHGGGFRDCGGRYDSSEMTDLCRSFARRGFIAATIEYRTGVLQLPPTSPDFKDYSVHQMLGIWRGGQDGRGGMRSMIQRERDSMEPYRFDTSKIFIGGNSAGSVIAMNIAYYNKPALLVNVFPTGINGTNVLGSINQKYYYGSDTISYSIKGVLDMWGGLLVPPSYVSNPENFFFVPGNKMPPLIAFCGKLDSTFNYRHQTLTYVPKSDTLGFYDSTSYCLNTSSLFSINPVIIGPDGWILGSQDIYEMFRRMGVATEFYLDCDMTHGLSGKSDFGIGPHTQAELEDYFAARAATFFQAIINNTASALRTTKFVSCENYRNTCDTTSNNNGCPYNKDSVNQVCQ